MKILIVDDSEPVRRIIWDMIMVVQSKLPDSPQFFICGAWNGAIGAQKALEHEFDLVFTDYLMPRLDGLQMVRALRRKGFTAPIVMLSSLADEKEQEAEEAGVTEIHMKPITFHVLEDIVLRFRQKMLEDSSQGANTV